MCFLLRFPSLLPLLYLASKHRPTTEKTPTQLPASKKALFLRLLPKKVVCIPKKVDSFPEKVSFLCLFFRMVFGHSMPLNSKL